MTNKWKLDVEIYKPTLVIDSMADDSYQTAQKIMSVSLDRKSSLFGKMKQFSGTLYYNLESSKNAYVEVNGDFYNNGTTSVIAGVSVGIGGAATINASVSYASNHYTYYRKARSYPVVVYACSTDC